MAPNDRNATLLTTRYFQHRLKNLFYVFYSELMLLIFFPGFINEGVGVGVLLSGQSSSFALMRS